MTSRPAILLMWLLLAMGTAHAVTPGEILPDARLEERARDLSAKLRCLVCQNQSIDDSDAELARDLRRIVRERVVAGEKDEAILQFLVARYGDFILLQPPFNPQTFLLWGTPILALILGGAAMWRAGRKRLVVDAAIAPLTSAEQSRLTGMTQDP